MGNFRRAALPGDNRRNPGYSRKSEKEAQARAKVPIDVAGCDHISRKGIDWDKFRREHERIFGKKGAPA